MRFGAILSFCGALIFPVTILAQSVFAQSQATVPAVAEATSTPADQLEVVTVTADKRLENAQDVPIAITSVSADTLKQFGVSGTAGLQAAVPGLNIEDPLGFMNLRLRGVGLNSTAPGNENSVTTYVDGVYISSATASLFALNNIASVEVDKGPQGTLFGRNATGGVVSITTRDPSQDFHATANVGYANYNTISTSDYITGGVTKDLAADLAIYYSNQMEGYGRNLVTGNRIGGEEDLALRSKWLWNPTDVDQLTVIFDYEYVNSAQALALRPIDGLPTELGGTNPGEFFGGPYSHHGGDYDIAVPFDPRMQDTQGGVSVKYRHDFAFGQLLSTTAYRQESNSVAWSPNPAPTYLEFATWQHPGNQFTQELQLSSQSDSVVKWVLGGYYFDAESTWAPFNLGGPFFDDFVFGTPANPVTGFIQIDTKQATQSEAVYGQTTLPVYGLPDTNVTLGVRYTSEDRNAFGKELGEFGNPPVGSPIITFVDLNAPGIPNHVDFDAFTYRVAIDHHFSENILGYVSYNTGFKSGGFNISSPGTPAFQPEHLGAAEVGLKSDWLGDRLRVNASAFDYDYSNIQVTQAKLASIVILNGASARIYGFDLDADAIITGHFSATVGLEVMRDRFTSFPNAPFLEPDFVTGGLDQVIGNAAGKQIPNVPEFTLSASGTYDVPTSFGPLDFTLSYYHNGGWFGGIENNPFLAQKPYNVVNFLATWTSPNNGYQISGFIHNLTDARYTQSLVELANYGGTAEDIFAPPRTIGVSLQVPF